MNLEDQIKTIIKEFQIKNDAFVGDKFELTNGKRKDIIEISTVKVSVNHNLQISQPTFIVKQYENGVVNEMFYEIARSTLKLRCKKIN